MTFSIGENLVLAAVRQNEAAPKKWMPLGIPEGIILGDIVSQDQVAASIDQHGDLWVWGTFFDEDNEE